MRSWPLLEWWIIDDTSASVNGVITDLHRHIDDA